MSYNHVYAQQNKSIPKTPRIKGKNRRARPCIEAALKQRLNDGNGHKMRLAIAAEYLNRGSSIPEAAQLFCSQDDYGDGSRSRYYVEDIARKGYKPSKCATIRG
jgi:DNA primase large subunit